jgi:hypothetical protein
LVEERNFAEFFNDCACDDFRKHHKPGLRVQGHGGVVLEQTSAISSADPGTADEGVTAVESDSWLDDDGSRRVD